MTAPHQRDRTGFVGRAFGWLFAFFLGVFGLGLSFAGYEEVARMRELERAPRIPTSAVITGEVNLTGAVRAHESPLKSPYTETPCVYYRYEVEREEKDSDGDTRWVTEHRSSRATRFHLEDAHGSVLVSGDDPGIEFEALERFQTREGNKRFTEWRIDPGDEISIFGFATRTGDVYQVGFTTPGAYEPTISHRNDEERRSLQAIASVLMILLSASSILGAVVMVLGRLRVHHSAVHLFVSSAVLLTTLWLQGHDMAMEDLKRGDESARRLLAEGAAVIGEVLERRGVPWDGDLATLGDFGEPRYAALDDEERLRLRSVRALAAQVVERTNQNLAQPLERYVGASVLGLAPFEPIPVPEIDRLTSELTPTRFGSLAGSLGLTLGGLLSLLGAWLGLSAIKLKRTIEALPSSPVSGIVYGLTEVVGRVLPVDPDATLVAPLSNRRCTHYRYVEEERRKSGKEEQWVTVRDETREIPFLCADESGSIRVDPKGAELHVARVLREDSGSRRYREWIVEPGEEVYVLGPAGIDEEAHDALRIASDGEQPFLVSSFTEREIMHMKAGSGFRFMTLGFVGSMAAGMFVAGSILPIGPLLYVITTASVALYVTALLVALYYNDLVFLRQRVRRAAANIEVALKKRFDLATRLVEVTKGALAHERHVHEAIAAVRRGAAIAVAEAYPELRGDELTRRLMQSLRELEDELALMRQGFNDAVERYNTRLRSFPELLIALPAGFEPEAFYAAETRSE